MTKVTRPTLPITNPAFQYTKAANTDLRALFARIALEQADAKTVRPIRKNGGK